MVWTRGLDFLTKSAHEKIQAEFASSLAQLIVWAGEKV